MYLDNCFLGCLTKIAMKWMLLFWLIGFKQVYWDDAGCWFQLEMYGRSVIRDGEWVLFWLYPDLIMFLLTEVVSHVWCNQCHFYNVEIALLLTKLLFIVVFNISIVKLFYCQYLWDWKPMKNCFFLQNCLYIFIIMH